MPPRKSDASRAATAEETTPAKDQLHVREGINIEDLNLPKSVVTRLAKGVLPPNTQIQGNAMLAMSKSATVFVNYVASHANDNAASGNRKTIAPQDVFNALEELEFPDFRNRLEAELARFNEIQADKRNTYRNRVASKASGPGEDDVTEDRDGRPAAKKARLEVREPRGEVGDGEEVDADQTQDEAGGEDEEVSDDNEENEEEEGDETLEVEDHLEEIEEKEVEDEALDNGEDSD